MGDSEQVKEKRVLRRIRFWLGVVVFGLVVSGVTAIPLVIEADLLHRAVNKYEFFGPEVREWVQAVYAGILDSNARYPFLFYGTDWLAFGHFVIAIAFIGPMRDPVRNKWVIDFGMIACVLIIPYAFLFGGIRGIPVWWRLIDCSFGVLGLIPLWLARRGTKRLEEMQGAR